MTTILIVVFSFMACEDDFDAIGTGVIGEPGFNASLYDEAGISAVNNNLKSVQTNNMLVNLLGYHNDEVYGGQKANVLSQLSLSSENPNFGTEPVMDSVVLSIPYFSSETEADDNGEANYQLDSIYGNGAIKLSIEESNLFLNTFDPETDFQNAQRYYSDMQPQIESNLTGNIIFEASEFTPSAEEIVTYGIDEEGEQDTIRSAPAMRLNLSNQFFQERILDKAGSSELTSNNNFRAFLRGLYFKTEAINNDGSLMMLNFRSTNAGITLYYTTKVPDARDVDEDGDLEELIEVQGSYKLNFGQAVVNTFEQEAPVYEEERLYVNGGEGSMVVLELFAGPDADEDGVSDELEYLRESEWLINEANLIFHVDSQKMAGIREPERLFLYNLTDNTVLADYVFEPRSGVNAINSRLNRDHLGPLQRDEDGNGISYKIRITEHVRRVINEGNDRVRLGLVVSQNVNLISNSAVREASEVDIKRIPASSVISPLGTVLYGPDAANEDKRLKLRLYYTETKN